MDEETDWDKNSKTQKKESEIDEPHEAKEEIGKHIEESKSNEPPPPPKEPPKENEDTEKNNKKMKIKEPPPPPPEERPGLDGDIEKDPKKLKIVQPPPPPPPLESPEFEDIEGFDVDELKKEIGVSELQEEEEHPEKILSEIQEERRRLEEERALFLMEISENEKKDTIVEESEEEEEEEEEIEPQPKVKSFAKERRKRKALERTKDYLFYGEFALMVILVMAMLYSEGISTYPLYLPLENSIYLILGFFLVFKIEKLYFTYLNMKYSGTLQRKVIGVEHFSSMEVPSILLWAFVVAAFIIPPTLGIIKILIKLISYDYEVIPFTSSFTLNLTLIFIAFLVTSIVWLVYLKWYHVKVLGPEIESISEPFVVDEVFLITNSGLLLRHIGREIKPDVDDDILSSMLTAVNEFVKDSFSASREEGELDELQYGKLRIILEYGKLVYLAAVVRGQESMELRPEMKRVLKQVHRKYGHILTNWDGSLASVKGIENPLKSLLKLG